MLHTLYFRHGKDPAADVFAGDMVAMFCQKASDAAFLLEFCKFFLQDTGYIKMVIGGDNKRAALFSDAQQLINRRAAKMACGKSTHSDGEVIMMISNIHRRGEEVNFKKAVINRAVFGDGDHPRAEITAVKIGEPLGL